MSAGSEAPAAAGKIWVFFKGADSWKLVSYSSMERKASSAGEGKSASSPRVSSLGVKKKRNAAAQETVCLTLAGDGDDGAGAETLEVPADRVALYNPSHDGDCDDVSLIDDLHEAPLLALLERRFAADSIYTNAGDVLISINPYRTISGLYDLPQAGRTSTERPHIFSVAQRAYAAMDSGNQVVLVNGESGAGKTEATKRMMRYLVLQTSGTHPGGPSESASYDSDHIENLVFSSNEIFEAFGNAKTIHNENSSRFGKFLEMQFARAQSRDDFYIRSLRAEHFILERSRLTLQQPGELNYHILYQLVAGVDDARRHALSLSENMDHYFMLRGGAYGTAPEDVPSTADLGVNEASLQEAFGRTVESFRLIGIEGEQLDNILQVLAGILALGNVEFADDDSHEKSVITENGKLWLQTAAPLLGLAGDGLSQFQHILTHRTTSAGTAGSRQRKASIHVIPLSLQQAITGRNGLIQKIYSALFDHLFAEFNRAAAPQNGGKPFESRTIGFLDIFGFEILMSNSFEQLCINFSNESLQKLFNNHIFVMEQQLYDEEGIDYSHIEFQDNTELLDLFIDRKTGIFPLIDEQGLLGKRGSDEAVLASLTKSHGRSAGSTGHPNFSRPRVGETSFLVHHYAGDVEYTVTGFLAKNNDSVHHDLEGLLESSEQGLLRRLFCTTDGDSQQQGVEEEEKKQQQGQLRRQDSHKLLGKDSISVRVRAQMESLELRINACQPHFVRCIKPNATRSAAPEFDRPLVLTQLRFLGLMETCRIRRDGFPVRRPFSELASQYAEITPSPSAAESKGEVSDTARARCRRLLEAHLGEEGALQGGWALGETRVFLRDGKLEMLDAVLAAERARKEHMEQMRAASVLQRTARARLARNELGRRKAQRAHEEEMARRAAAEAERLRLQREREEAEAQRLRELNAAIAIQAAARARAARAEADRRRKDRDRKLAAIRIQAVQRANSEKRAYEGKRKAAVQLQSLARTRSGKSLYQKQRAAATSLQAHQRRMMARRQHLRQLRSARLLQKVWRGIRVRARYNIVLNARRDWKDLLAPNEAVIFASLIRKEAGQGVAKLLGIKRRRQLLLTSAARLLYVCPVDMCAKGDINIFSDDFRLDLTQDHDFDVHTTSRIYHFTDLLDHPRTWVDAVRNFKVWCETAAASSRSAPTAAEEKVSSTSYIGVSDLVSMNDALSHAELLQGYLVKQSIKGRFGKKWTKRWFVLHGLCLYYFKSE